MTITYIGTKIINAVPMNRLDYNILRGWTLPADENGSDEGYLVEYLDGGKANVPGYAGYVSWSPKDVFERAYRPTTAMSFGDALVALEAGKKVARAGWNGKGLWLEHVAPTAPCDLPFIRMSYPVTGLTTGPYPNGARVPWLASQTDMLVKDWVIVP